MLILKRAINERIVIDGKIVITFLGVESGRARIGIDAPRDIVVDRYEVHMERSQASQASQAKEKLPCST